MVLPGACIGRNVVIAAGSVVRGTVPDRCVVAGVPARVVRSYVPGDGWSARPTVAAPVSAWTGPGTAGTLLAPLPGGPIPPDPPWGEPTPPIPPGVERVEGLAQPVDPAG